MSDTPNNLAHLDSSLNEVWKAIEAVPRGWSLAGGTAIVLYYGHRRSTDLDWYAPPGEVDEDVIKALTCFEGYGTLYKITGGSGMVDCVLRPRYSEFREIEMTFFESFRGFVPPPKHQPILSTNRAHTPVMHPIDLAACKISSVISRGALRDFEDLSVLAVKRPHHLKAGLLQLTRVDDIDIHKCLMSMINPGDDILLPEAVGAPLRTFVSEFEPPNNETTSHTL